MFFTIVKSGADLLVTAILSTSLAAMILIYFWIVSTTIISCWDRYSGLVEHNVFVQRDLQFGIGIAILVPGILLLLVTSWWLLKSAKSLPLLQARLIWQRQPSGEVLLPAK